MERFYFSIIFTFSFPYILHFFIKNGKFNFRLHLHYLLLYIFDRLRLTVDLVLVLLQVGRN